MDLTLPHDMIEISALLPKVQAALEGIDPNLASEYLMSAAITFATETRIMRLTRCIDTVPCVTSYSLKTNPYRIAEVAKIEHTSENYHSPRNIATLINVEGNTLYVDGSVVVNTGKIIIELVVAPKRGGDTIPYVLYEEWEPAIISGALADLYLMSGAVWGNKGLADRHEKAFADSIKRARFKRTTRSRPISIRLSPKWSSR